MIMENRVDDLEFLFIDFGEIYRYFKFNWFKIEFFSFCFFKQEELLFKLEIWSFYWNFF